VPRSYLCWIGVYGVECTANGRMLIGASADIVNRWQMHRYLLRRGRHGNRELQSDWDQHGEGAFKCTVLEETGRDRSTLRSRERAWIETLSRSASKLYNGPDRRGRPKLDHRPPRFAERLAASPEHAARLKALHDELERERAAAAKEDAARREQDLLKRERSKHAQIGKIGLDSDW
jgi:hypothetical protein